MNTGLVILGFGLLSLIALRLFLYLIRDAYLTGADPTSGRKKSILDKLQIDQSALTHDQLLEIIKTHHEQQTEKIRLYTSIVISVVVIISALLVLLSGSSNEDSTKWSVGAVGTIIGYWLKGK